MSLWPKNILADLFSGDWYINLSSLPALVYPGYSNPWVGLSLTMSEPNVSLDINSEVQNKAKNEYLTKKTLLIDQEVDIFFEEKTNQRKNARPKFLPLNWITTFVVSLKRFVLFEEIEVTRRIFHDISLERVALQLCWPITFPRRNQSVPQNF